MRQKIGKIITLVLIVAVIVSSGIIAESAGKSTSYTFALSTESGELEIVDDAFMAVGAYLELGLNSAQDMDVKNGLVYIADTNNKRVLILNPDSASVKEVGVGILSKPMGVAADEEGRIYVADYANQCVYRFSAGGELELTFERPESVLYGESAAFAPRKVAPDGNGGVYIVVDGSVNGLVQMDSQGEFLGYFASNQVNKSLYAKFLDIFLTDEQLAKFTSFIPDSYGNIFMGVDGLVYATCMGSERAIQKLSYSGSDIFSGREDMYTLDDIMDICMSPDGYIYILTADGMITEMTSDGHLLYSFGGKIEANAYLGLTDSPAGIGVDEQGAVFVLDKTRNVIHVYEPTDSHQEIIYALNCYQAGEYSETKEILLNTLKYNSTSYFAHYYLGLVYMHEGDYETAADEFAEAKAWAEYSEAYWDIRNEILQDNLIYIFAVIVAVAAVMMVWKKKNPRSAYNSYFGLDIVRNQWQQYKPSIIRRTIYHPVDTAYMLREGQMGHGYLAPVLVILVGYTVFSAWRLCSGPVFSTTLEDYSLVVNLGFYIVLFGLFIVCHYLIVSLLDGEGSLRMIVSAVSYAMLPFILLFPVFTLLKNFLTLNEKLLVTTIEAVIMILCAVLLLVMLKIIHDYSVKKLVGTLLLTIFLMCLVVVFGSLLFVLCAQIVNFISQVYTEVIIRG